MAPQRREQVLSDNAVVSAAGAEQSCKIGSPPVAAPSPRVWRHGDGVSVISEAKTPISNEIDSPMSSLFSVRLRNSMVTVTLSVSPASMVPRSRNAPCPTAFTVDDTDVL